MFDKWTLLGITVSKVDNAADAVTVNDENTAFWVVFLLAVIIVCIILGKYLPEIKNTLRNRKKESAELKAEKARNEELERLHRIKEKNKRK